VTPLPPALQPWAEELAHLAPEVVLSLGPMIRRISATLGPLGTRQRLGEGEPDGFEGIARRGPYDRLLISEWALAEEVPEEFLRRAIASEHLFLAERRLVPAASRRAVVLLDAGPDALGMPRLAQVAALAALRRRARLAGAHFAWGLLQGQGLAPDLDPAALARLAQGRTLQPPTRAHLEAWLKEVGPPAEPDDLWLVGGAALARLEPPGHWLSIDDPCCPPDGQLELCLHLAGGPQRLSLQVPPEDQAVGLLRALWRPPVPPPTPAPGLRPERGFHLSWDGRRLITVNDRGDLVALHVPNSVKAARKQPPGRPRRVPVLPDSEVVAGGSAGKLVFALMVVEEEDLLLTGTNLHRALGLATLHLPEGLASLHMVRTPRGREYLLTDGKGACWRLGERGTEPLRPSTVRVLAVDPDGVWVHDPARGLRREPHFGTFEAPWTPVTGRVLVRGPEMAMQDADGRWRVLGGKPFSVEPDTVEGLVDHRSPAHLLCLSQDRRRLTVRLDASIAVVAQREEPIVAVSTAGSGAAVAILDASGSIEVIDVDHHEPLLRLAPGEAS